MPRKRQRSAFAESEYQPPRKSARTKRGTPVCSRVAPLAEKKFHDTIVQSTAIGTAAWTAINPTGDSLSAIAQGDTGETRDGRVYHIESIGVHGNVQYSVSESAAAPPAGAVVRVVFGVDRQTNNTVVTPSNVMTDGGAAGEEYNGWKNLDNVDRYQILMDKTITINPVVVNEGAANLFAVGKTERQFKFWKKFNPPLKVVTSLATGVVGAISDNSIFCIVAAKNTGTAGISYSGRVRFLG